MAGDPRRTVPLRIARLGSSWFEALAPGCAARSATVFGGGCDGAERRWRHLDTMQQRNLLIAEVPRVPCQKRGERQVADGGERLKRTRDLWLRNPDRKSPERWREFGPLRDSRLTVARGWAIDSRIQWVERMACGYRKRENFRHAIGFHLGGPDLYPDALESTHPKA